MKNRRDSKPLTFDQFARFERVGNGTPPFYCPPPEWAAAAHAIVIGDTVHYLWAKRRADNYWALMHSTAPASNPVEVTHDPDNPVLTPREEGFDDFATEYPFPFFNPADQTYYCYYLGRRLRIPKQTGLLVSTGDFGPWKRVTSEPVIAVEYEHEVEGSSHPSVAIDDETIHIVYTGEVAGPPTICHATANVRSPEKVTKDDANPVFHGSGSDWDSRGVREAEILRGAEFFHIFYGGTDGATWRIGHVRTKDFRTFEPNPHNPIFEPAADPEAWDSDGLLTPQVFEVNGTFWMLYAGLKGREWQSGFAVAR